MHHESRNDAKYSLVSENSEILSNSHITKRDAHTPPQDIVLTNAGCLQNDQIEKKMEYTLSFIRI